MLKKALLHRTILCQEITYNLQNYSSKIQNFLCQDSEAQIYKVIMYAMKA